MARVLLYIFLFVFPLVQITAQEKDSLSSFIENNPNAVDFNIIFEGTKLNLSADDNEILINMSFAHPALQMRFLMQKALIYVDPSGKKKKKYEISMPSAFDVKEELEARAPQRTENNIDERPDIRPVISALNKKGGEIRYGSSTIPLGYQRFYIEFDPVNEVLNYYILIPKQIFMQDRKLNEIWSLGIMSINDFANMPPPGHEGEGGMMPPPIENENSADIQELMQSDIKEWIKFSIDEIMNINLK